MDSAQVGQCAPDPTLVRSAANAIACKHYAMPPPRESPVEILGFGSRVDYPEPVGEFTEDQMCVPPLTPQVEAVLPFFERREFAVAIDMLIKTILSQELEQMSDELRDSLAHALSWAYVQAGARH
eukprot:TRINITY_DN25796_c0_g2_i1.p1 TRINITY_DN25796_c0_g2~~TRINITY_DN25796_c0_g2_i1.p1  ORF type:complete len:125 (-),score=23.20 TRINITY_DN25796_c0_g2_i1:23-397(-)